MAKNASKNSSKKLNVELSYTDFFFLNDTSGGNE